METIKVCSCQHLHRLESSSCSRSCSQQLVAEFLASSLPISHIRPFTNISPPYRTPQTTSLRPSKVPVLRHPRRPTSQSQRTPTQAWAPAPPPQRMPSSTRRMRPATTPRLMSTRVRFDCLLFLPCTCTNNLLQRLPSTKSRFQPLLTVRCDILMSVWWMMDGWMIPAWSSFAFSRNDMVREWSWSELLCIIWSSQEPKCCSIPIRYITSISESKTLLQPIFIISLCQSWLYVMLSLTCCALLHPCHVLHLEYR